MKPLREKISNPQVWENFKHPKWLHVFFVVDMSNYHWYQKLSEELSFLCVFNSSLGRYRFKRMPFVISSARKVAQTMVEKHIGDILGALPIFDDKNYHCWGQGLNKNMIWSYVRFWSEQESAILNSTVTKFNFLSIRSSTWVKYLVNWDFNQTQNKCLPFMTCPPRRANKTCKGCWVWSKCLQSISQTGQN